MSNVDSKNLVIFTIVFDIALFVVMLGGNYHYSSPIHEVFVWTFFSAINFFLGYFVCFEATKWKT